MTFQAVQKTGDNIRLYHTDHLGSTALVTDIDGEVTQHVAYIPYGEIFIEQRNGSWSSPYLFNAKELDEETGLYYYGARYLDPTGTRWLSVDPLFEKYVGMTPYGYCAGNPVKLVDVDGKAVYGRENEDGSMSYAIIDNADVEKYGDTYNSPGNGSYKYIDDSYDYDGKKTDYTGIVVDHTTEAVSHYYSGNGEPVVILDVLLCRIVQNVIKIIVLLLTHSQAMGFGIFSGGTITVEILESWEVLHIHMLVSRYKKLLKIQVIL